METEQVAQELHQDALKKSNEELAGFLETGDHTVGGAAVSEELAGQAQKELSKEAEELTKEAPEGDVQPADAMDAEENKAGSEEPGVLAGEQAVNVAGIEEAPAAQEEPAAPAAAAEEVQPAPEAAAGEEQPAPEAADAERSKDEQVEKMEEVAAPEAQEPDAEPAPAVAEPAAAEAEAVDEKQSEPAAEAGKEEQVEKMEEVAAPEAQEPEAEPAAAEAEPAATEAEAAEEKQPEPAAEEGKEEEQAAEAEPEAEPEAEAEAAPAGEAQAEGKEGEAPAAAPAAAAPAAAPAGGEPSASKRTRKRKASREAAQQDEGGVEEEEKGGAAAGGGDVLPTPAQRRKGGGRGAKKAKKEAAGGGGGGAKGPTASEQYLAAIQEIPAGQTRTYTDVAVAAGRPNGARSVGKTIKSLDLGESEVPWHRVVGSDGKMQDGELGAKQLARLQEEGARPKEGESVFEWAKRTGAHVVGTYTFAAEKFVFTEATDPRVDDMPRERVEKFVSVDDAEARGFVRLSAMEVDQ